MTEAGASQADECTVKYLDGSTETLLPPRIKPFNSADAAAADALAETTASGVGDNAHDDDDASSVSDSDDDGDAAGEPATPQKKKKPPAPASPIEQVVGADEVVSEEESSSGDESPDRGAKKQKQKKKKKKEEAKQTKEKQHKQTPHDEEDGGRSGGGATVDSKYSLGDRVLALFDRGVKWYSGKVKGVIEAASVGGAPSYDITYDDGDKEAGVDESLMRPHTT